MSKRRRRRKGGNGNSREALRARARKQWQDRKIAARMRAGLRRQANSPAGRAQRRGQALALWGDPDYRARMLAIATGPAGRTQRSKQSRAAGLIRTMWRANAGRRSANKSHRRLSPCSTVQTRHVLACACTSHNGMSMARAKAVSRVRWLRLRSPTLPVAIS